MVRDPQAPDLDPEPLCLDAIQVRRRLSALYGLPEVVFVCTVKPILQAVEDHVLFPFTPYWSHQRWARNRGNILVPGYLPNLVDGDNGEEEDGFVPLPLGGRHGILGF
ncbi:hypothetical protein E2562_018192 [Oryza meyeriana var. granulata]|uniref:Uncharacterized protein n=1 Tax=Oryza meyeriana var. granulata TaxID=110450 RepID=A0A6G1C7W7_9ORYZ|nr:hypothetical protein E2562_018192 [Oryza meyeriana var. granulata]